MIDRPALLPTSALLSTILCACLLPALGAAQQPLVVDDNYRLQSGDVILVSVLGEEKLGGALSVGPGGSIALPVVGSVPVVGNSLRETRELITRHYRDVMRHPFVSIALDENASRRRVYVGGSVEKPGSQLLPFGSTLPDAVVAAGFTADSDLSQVTVRRVDGEIIRADLTGLRTRQPLDTTIVLQWDDRVYVPASELRLTVAGQVVQPGVYPVPLGRRVRLLDLIAQLGGGLTEQAGPRARLIRSGEDQPIEIDLSRMLEQGDLAQNYELQPGDVVIVPRATAQEIVVTGAVDKGGVIDIRNQTPPTLLAVLAGVGRLPSSDFGRVSVYRDGEHIVANADAALKQGDMRHNPVLRPGDVVYVPETGKVALLGAFLRTGLLDYDPNRSFMDYLAAGGLGPSEAARLQEGVVIRTRPDGTYETVNFDLSHLAQGKIPEPIKLKPGDVIYVPTRGTKGDLWTQLRDVMFVAGAMRGLLP
jgi:polysaccharide export outer membrane protein